MKRITFLAVIALMVALVGCKNETNEPQNNESQTDEKKGETDSLSAFVGTYDLEIVTDSVQNNGTWFSNSVLPEGTRVPTRYGRLTVTRSTTEGTVDVLGRIDIAGDSVDYYRTTGTLDAQGRLQLASGQDYQGATSTKHFVFQPIGTDGVFKVDAEYEFNGTPMVERATNTIKNKR